MLRPAVRPEVTRARPVVGAHLPAPGLEPLKKLRRERLGSREPLGDGLEIRRRPGAWSAAERPWPHSLLQEAAGAAGLEGDAGGATRSPGAMGPSCDLSRTWAWL